MSMPTRQEYLNVISSKLSGFEQFAEEFGKTRFLVYESEIQAPDEKFDAMIREQAEMEAIADAFKCEIVQEDETFTLYFYFDERNPGGFLEIVDAGMPAPSAGGDNGLSHNPDGSTYRTPTPQERWDEPVPGYAKPATGVIKEIRTMLADLFRNEMHVAIESAKQDILSLVKRYTAEKISEVTGG
jgi:hypothetical protein